VNPPGALTVMWGRGARSPISTMTARTTLLVGSGSSIPTKYLYTTTQPSGQGLRDCLVEGDEDGSVEEPRDEVPSFDAPSTWNARSRGVPLVASTTAAMRLMEPGLAHVSADGD
jgi:hypothetical protein